MEEVAHPDPGVTMKKQTQHIKRYRYAKGVGRGKDEDLKDFSSLYDAIPEDETPSEVDCPPPPGAGGDESPGGGGGQSASGGGGTRPAGKKCPVPATIAAKRTGTPASITKYVLKGRATPEQVFYEVSGGVCITRDAWELLIVPWSPETERINVRKELLSQAQYLYQMWMVGVRLKAFNTLEYPITPQNSGSLNGSITQLAYGQHAVNARVNTGKLNFSFVDLSDHGAWFDSKLLKATVGTETLGDQAAERYLGFPNQVSWEYRGMAGSRSGHPVAPRPTILIMSVWYGHFYHTLSDNLLPAFMTMRALGYKEANIVALIKEDEIEVKPRIVELAAALGIYVQFDVSGLRNMGHWSETQHRLCFPGAKTMDPSTGKAVSLPQKLVIGYLYEWTIRDWGRDLKRFWNSDLKNGVAEMQDKLHKWHFRGEDYPKTNNIQRPLKQGELRHEKIIWLLREDQRKVDEPAVFAHLDTNRAKIFDKDFNGVGSADLKSQEMGKLPWADAVALMAIGGLI